MNAAAARRWALCVSAVLAAVGGGVVFGLWTRQPPAPELLRAGWLTRASGWLAAAFLLGSLGATPLQRARARFGRTSSRALQLAALRRAFGLTAASFAGLHALYATTSLPGTYASLLGSAWLRAGLLALAILLALALTSFEALVRRLHFQRWKELHRLVYLAAFALALHVVLGPFGDPRWELALLVILASLLALRVGTWASRAKRAGGAQAERDPP